jgi:hypothetical protein
MKKKLFTLFEIFVWAVIFLIPAFFILTLLHPDLKAQKYYNVDFYDVNGVIVGSPVNFIGYNVGYVKKIKVLEDKVNVNIAITHKDFVMPKCTVIKVEESGLGGSRSLEVFPCDGSEKQNGIYTQTPKRITEILQDACDFIDGLNETMTNVLIMLDCTIGETNYCKYEKLQREIVQTDKELRQAKINLEKIEKNTKINLKKTQANIINTINSIKAINFNPQEVKNQTFETEQKAKQINTAVQKYDPKAVKQTAQDFYIKTEVMNVPDKNTLNQQLHSINTQLDAITTLLNTVENHFQPKSLQEKHSKVKKIRKNTQKLTRED